MAGVAVEAGGPLATAIQSTVQPKLVENGWVAEENDTTLSEYVTMMLVNGKNLQGVAQELGNDLLGVGEDDPGVVEFAGWLFEQVPALAGTSAAADGSGNAEMQQDQSEQQASSAMDSQMDDATPVDGAPSGPKAMRDGGAGRGRGRRMMGQLNNHMTRDNSLPDSLRRIKGAAGGQHGRINTHAGRDPPRGPKNQNLANGMQRMMNGGGRGGRMNQNNPMMQQGQMMNQLDPQQQMAFMQMMEMQANMMTQLMQNGQMPNMQQNGGGHGGKSMFDRVDKRQPNGHFKGGRGGHHNQRQNDGQQDSGMDLDSELGTKKDPFETECKFNLSCTIPTCPFAHQSPAAPPKPADQKLDMTDTCPMGVACANKKCTARHPSPASKNGPGGAGGFKQDVDCKFFPNCTNPSCPFRHPTAPPCRNGADCSVPGCTFTHSKISCRYNPCTKPSCPFKHVEGQKGVFKDKVWTADGVPNIEGEGEGNANGTSERFKGFAENEDQAEELIIPGQDQSSSSQQQQQVEGQVMT